MAKQRSRPRLWLHMLFILLLIGMIVIGYFGYEIWSAASRIYEPPTQAKSDKRLKEAILEHDPIGILLLGVDERAGDVGRSDTIVIATVNPNQKTVMLTNIPRDTRVNIPGYRGKDKINHSYAYGGVDLTRKTVENFLDVPIDGYVKINMEGLEKIVDELGGIEVNVPFDFIFDGNHFKQGKMMLNGREALAFARMRKEDPFGDFGRIKRQQEVIRAIITKGTQLSSIPRLHNIMEALGANMKTDISPLQMFHLQQTYAQVKDEDMITNQIRGHSTRINGIYYFIVSDEEVNRIRTILLDHLELGETER